MSKPLKILFVCSELSPLVSTGGLADVTSALPRALRKEGHDVRVALPCYDTIPAEYRGDETCMCVARVGTNLIHGALRVSHVPETDIPLYLIEHHEFFSRGTPYGFGNYEFEDNADRFCFFCQAVLDGVPQLDWRPDVIHCNDWHTAVLPAYLHTQALRDDSWSGLPSVFTLHNLNFQGRYPASRLAQTGLREDLFTEDCLEFYGDINLMKAGIAFASKLNTVSPRYAKEILTAEFGAGLNGFLATRKKDISGILNGVDYETWNPATDPLIPWNYSVDSLERKADCKAALQAAVGLPQRDVPVFATVSRITWQKGIDILLDTADQILANDVQLIVLGAGDPFYEHTCRDALSNHPGKMSATIGFDVPLSHLIQAGADFFLMPSRYEPCGLSQMYSLAYGTVPIVHKTGGLANSVRQATKMNLEKGQATGILFSPCDTATLVKAVQRALRLYKKPKDFDNVRKAGMKEDFSWMRAAKEYVELYRKAMANPEPPIVKQLAARG